MATAAERQRAYRQRQLHELDGAGARLNMVVTVQAKAQLERLARHHGMTQRALLERLLAQAEQGASSAPGYFGIVTA